MLVPGSAASAPLLDPFDPEVTVIAIGLETLQNETESRLMDCCKHMVEVIDRSLCDSVIRATRVGSEDTRRSVVKLAFSTKEAKIKLLRQKRKLSLSYEYRKVFLRSSQHLAVRIMESNFRTLLANNPASMSGLRVDSNGRLHRDRLTNQDHRSAALPWSAPQYDTRASTTLDHRMLQQPHLPFSQAPQRPAYSYGLNVPGVPPPLNTLPSYNAPAQNQTSFYDLSFPPLPGTFAGPSYPPSQSYSGPPFAPSVSHSGPPYPTHSLRPSTSAYNRSVFPPGHNLSTG